LRGTAGFYPHFIILNFPFSHALLVGSFTMPRLCATPICGCMFTWSSQPKTASQGSTKKFRNQGRIKQMVSREPSSTVCVARRIWSVQRERIQSPRSDQVHRESGGAPSQNFISGRMAHVCGETFANNTGIRVSRYAATKESSRLAKNAGLVQSGLPGVLLRASSTRAANARHSIYFLWADVGRQFLLNSIPLTGGSSGTGWVICSQSAQSSC
jgi:hypothetical protein